MINLVKQWGWAGVLLTALSSAGCSSSDAAQPTAEGFPTQVANIVCGALGPCCATLGASYNGNSCTAYAQGVYQAKIARVGMTQTWDGAAAQRCLNELQAATKDCGGVTDYNTVDCQQLTVGTVPIGGVCKTSGDCAPQPTGTATCAIAANGAATCQASGALKKLGEPCRGGNECVPGLTCDFVSGNCLTPSGDGAVCSEDGDCMSDTCTSSVCAHRALTDNAACGL